MANYVGRARTNYFAVKNAVAFKEEFEQLDLEVIDHKEGDTTLYGLMSNSDNGGWPSDRYDEAADEYEPLDLPAMVAAHLVDGHVAVFLEIGWEKMRYLVGQAFAVNAAGTVVSLNLEDEITERAKVLGDHITPVAS